MANQNPIPIQSLTPGRTFLIAGVVSFSHITRQYAGEDLRKQQERDQRNGRQPQTKPYTTISVQNAQVLCGNPSAPTIEEQYASGRIYMSNSKNYQGPAFTAVSKGNVLPWVAMNENGTLREVKPERELANGLNVILVMKVLPTKPNYGIGLEGVIVNEAQIRYFAGSDIAPELSRYGFNLQLDPSIDRSVAASDDDGQGGAPAGGGYMPAQSAAPAQAPMGATPFQTQQQPQNQPQTGAATPFGQNFAPMPPTGAGVPTGAPAQATGVNTTYNPGTDPARQY